MPLDASAAPPASVRRLLAVLRGLLAAFLVALALVHLSQVVNYSQYYRGIGGVAVSGLGFLVLAALLFVRSRVVRWTAAWIGCVLALACLLTPLVRDLDYIALEPNLVEVIDVQGDGMPGIAGVQHIRTDARGFRTTEAIDYEHAARGLRIFTIGGSTTEEIHHDDRRTWSHLLGERLESLLGEDVQVANTGVSGTRTPHHAATLAHVVPYHPDVAIFLVGVNDWNEHVRRVMLLGPGLSTEDFRILETHRRLRALTLGESILASALERAKAAGLSTTAQASSRRVERGEYYTRQNHSLDRPRKVEFRPDRVDPIFDAYLRQIAETCRGSGIVCVFVTQPHGYRAATDPEFRARFWMTPPNVDYTLDLASLEALADLYNRHLARVGAELGVTVCDVASGIEPSFRHLYDEVHLNLEGSRRFAELLAPCVADALASSGRRTEPSARAGARSVS
jgi:lysophospholipase L1-like esterase